MSETEARAGAPDIPSDTPPASAPAPAPEPQEREPGRDGEDAEVDSAAPGAMDGVREELDPLAGHDSRPARQD